MALVVTMLTAIGASLTVQVPGWARTVPTAPIEVLPAPGAAVSAGDTVNVVFTETVSSVTAGWGLAGATTQLLPVELGTTGTSATVLLPTPLPQARLHRLELTATTATGGTLTRSVDYYGTVTSTPRRVGPATRVMTGTSTVFGTRGKLFRFTIEVHQPLSSQMQPLAQEALRVLTDPTRGWTARGAYRLQRIDDPERADIRLMVARPPLVDRLCLKAGLHTGGVVSCWNHEFAALNSDRWFTGALSRGFSSLRDYRTYLISHEFGHGLHLHHAYCPGRGALAPVMLQQTGGQDGCRTNGWPYPR